MRFGIVILLFLLSFPTALGGSDASIRGDYLEVRSNHVFTCGCLQSGEAVTSGRKAILAWKFEQGEFSGIDLSGVKVVAVIVGSGSLSFGEPSRRSALFIGGIFSERQKRAALGLFRLQYPKLLGEIVSVRTSAIRFEEHGSRTMVIVPDIAKVVARKARLPEDAEPGSQLWYDPFVPVVHRELATVLHDEYWGRDISHRWRTHFAGIRGYKGKFALP